MEEESETPLENEDWRERLIYRHSRAGRWARQKESLKRRSLRWYMRVAAVAGILVGVVVALIILQVMK